MSPRKRLTAANHPAIKNITFTPAAAAAAAPVGVSVAPGVYLPPGFVPSPQQAAFLRVVAVPGPSVVLEAVAGAGKTTTLVYAMYLMAGDSILVAFNTKIVKEVEEKAREKGVFDAMRHVICTVHSAGFKAIRARNSKIRVEEKKSILIAREFAARNPKLDDILVPAVALVGLAKQGLLATRKEAQPAWAAAARRHNLDDAIPEGRTMRELVTFAQAILDKSNERRGECVDFDDMVYLPAMFSDYPIRQYDNVLLDEAQDTNAARRALAGKMLRPGGRLFACGDRHQALYAFTGADSAALDMIAETFDAVRMPLSVSYRCPRAVVAEARQHVEHIEAHASAPEGIVRHVHVARDKLATLGLTEKDAIICRTNKPLIRTAYDLIAAGIPCKVEGRDIGRSLGALLKKVTGGHDTMTTEEVLSVLAEWLRTEQEAAQKKDDEARAKVAEDKHGALVVIADKARSRGQLGRGALVPAMLAEIEALFADDVKGRLTLSSIHKAKGREWRRVFWLQAAMGRNPKRPPQPWEVETEVCCNYVAITRAQDELVYLTIPEEK
jgi:DNA helicase-2/ATP-dependent DNA helicase PcrA